MIQGHRKIWPQDRHLSTHNFHGHHRRFFRTRKLSLTFPSRIGLELIRDIDRSPSTPSSAYPVFPNHGRRLITTFVSTQSSTTR